MPKHHFCLNHRSAWTPRQSLQWPAWEAGWEGTCRPARTQGPLRSQGTPRCLCHLWVSSGQCHQRDTSANTAEVEESPIGEKCIYVDSALNIELKGEKHGRLFLLICVYSNKFKFSCKYATGIWTELWGTKTTPMWLEGERKQNIFV